MIVYLILDIGKIHVCIRQSLKSYHLHVGLYIALDELVKEIMPSVEKDIKKVVDKDIFLQIKSEENGINMTFKTFPQNDMTFYIH
jgi:hypothetical protein